MKHVTTPRADKACRVSWDILCFGESGARAYGRVFIAWGVAGLLAPWSAGFIYDWQAGYQSAMLIAALLALASAVFAALFRLAETGQRGAR